ncbi:hypothetical protein BDW22DRAFT_1482729 [Trametopsis cervina]|nr:hypothetical protein BDW22DRAFT_1482729 [Trametopsis cervina]
MKLKGITCSVTHADDAPFTEYQQKAEKGANEICCHIASEAGKVFVIDTAVDEPPSNPGTGFLGKVFIDGQQVASQCRPSKIYGIYTGANTLTPFMFSSVELTDDDAVLRSMNPNVTDLGTIRVQLHRATWTRSHIPWQPVSPFHLENKPVHEKAKKAGGHRTVVGNEQACGTRVQAFDLKLLDPDNAPYATFTFRYRPKAILQAQGIVPLDQPVAKPADKQPAEAGPSNRPAKRRRTDNGARDERPGSGSGSDSRAGTEGAPDLVALQAEWDALEAQKAALQARIRAAESGGGRVKRERSATVAPRRIGDVIDLSDGPDTRRRSVKRERPPIVLGDADGDVIDLTGD